MVNHKAKLSGEGILGNTCHRCGCSLELEDEELDLGIRLETYICCGCETRYEAKFKEISWREL